MRNVAVTSSQNVTISRLKVSVTLSKNVIISTFPTKEDNLQAELGAGPPVAGDGGAQVPGPTQGGRGRHWRC